MVKWHPPRSAGGSGAKGPFKAAESFLRWMQRHGQGAKPSDALPHHGGIPAHPVGIKGAKQREHVPGTPEFEARKRRGQQGSAWNGDERYANEHTYEAWSRGTTNPRNPRQRDLDFGYTTGHTVDGKPQTKVRVHMDDKGMIHGHPKT